MSKFFIILLCVTMLSIFISCSSEDACETITCLNDGVCIDGTCECTLGFEGDTCDADARLKFIGSYILVSQTGNCNNLAPTFEIVDLGNSITDLILILPMIEVLISLDSANSFTDRIGFTGILSDNMIVATLNGDCEGIYLRQ